MMNRFPEISLLITHYNRARSLENLLQTFYMLDCEFGDIVVSDDGSNDEHIEHVLRLQVIYGFRLVRAPVNKGLGNNINKGQDAITTPFTLYIQEDFEPSEKFPNRLAEAVNFMHEDANLDIVRFYAYCSYPYLEYFNKHFSAICIRPFGLDYNKIYSYSDHPHLRRSTFFAKFGRYPEGLKGDRTEYKMCINFIKQKGKGLFYNDYQSLFTQKNSQEEPSTMRRVNWKSSPNLLVRFPRYCYRQIKYNYDIFVGNC